MKKVVKVPTIHCEGCVESVKFMIRRVPGVQDVTGDPKSKTVTVEFDERTLNEGRIQEAIRQAGHRAEV